MPYKKTVTNTIVSRPWESMTPNNHSHWGESHFGGFNPGRLVTIKRPQLTWMTQWPFWRSRKMSLFDAFVRDFFGADPFSNMMRPAPPPRPAEVHRVTHMVEGLIMQPQSLGGGGQARTFRQYTYSSGSKSLNNIQSHEKKPNRNTGDNRNKPLAITYKPSAPRPINPLACLPQQRSMNLLALPRRL